MHSIARAPKILTFMSRRVNAPSMKSECDFPVLNPRDIDENKEEEEGRGGGGEEEEEEEERAEVLIFHIKVWCQYTSLV